MGEPKPFASLSSGLLARKGAAKPAMRPQGFGQGVSIEDLGWNDMGFGQQPDPALGESFREHVPSSIAALTPAPRTGADFRVPEEAPPVVEQQRAIEASFAASKPAKPRAPRARAAAPAAAAPVEPARPRTEPGSKSKAAFTLRLDANRHLKLRLACAVTHRSAQQIVTQALDEYLGSLPELEAIVRQAAAGSRN